MRLILLHGRDNPEEDMDDWGYDGPSLNGVACVHWTYGNFNVAFKTKKAFESAKAATGWRTFCEGDLVLEMPTSDELVQTVEPEKDGKPSFYGDWELQSPGFQP